MSFNFGAAAAFAPWNERIRNTSESNSLPPWGPEKDWAEAPIPWNELVSRWSRSRELLEEEDSEFSDRGSGETGSWA
jgi:hypothetical protein